MLQGIAPSSSLAFREGHWSSWTYRDIPECLPARFHLLRIVGQAFQYSNGMDLGSSSDTALPSTTSLTDGSDGAFEKRRPLSILDLKWDVYMANVLMQDCLSFTDCYNMLLVTHGASLTLEQFEAMLAERSMDFFWETKFKSLHSELHSSLVIPAASAERLESISWFMRLRLRSDTSADIRRTLVNFRREMLRFNLAQQGERQDQFLSRLLGSDPTDVRYPFYDVPRSVHDAGRDGQVPSFTVITSNSEIAKQGPIVSAFEIGLQSRTENIAALTQVAAQFCELPAPGFDVTNVDCTDWAHTLTPLYARDELVKIVNSLEGPLRLTNGGLLYDSRPGKMANQVLLGKLLLTKSSGYDGVFLSDKFAVKKRQSNSEFQRILPVGSFVSYRTKSLVTPNSGLHYMQYGAVSGWETRGHGVDQRILYQVLPFTFPTHDEIESDYPAFYRTSHNIGIVADLIWIVEISFELRGKYLSSNCAAHFYPFFEGLGECFFDLSPELSGLYPDDRAAQHRFVQGRKMDAGKGSSSPTSPVFSWAAMSKQ